MKNMKKIYALLLAMVMIFSMTMTTYAEGKEGSITINDAVVGQTYTIYQILDLESYNAASGAYSYKATNAWKDFINSVDNTETEEVELVIKGVYVNVDDQGYVTWNTGADAAAFAKLAQAYAKEKGIDSSAEPIEATETTVKFEKLDLGYYLVDTTLGTLCSLDTTNPDVEMNEKNEEPTVTKEVQEDSDSSWGETNDADFNQTVTFRATITVQTGAENYVLHDTMSAGLTYDEIQSVKIDDTDVDEANYSVNTETADGCTFEVSFDDAYIGSLEAGTKIVVTYTATLNENAVVGLNGNENKVKLEYGDESEPTFTPEDTTITYTWDTDVVKYTTKDGTEIKLAGAVFSLSKNEDGKNTLAFTQATDANGEPLANTYKYDPEGTITQITTDSTGTFTIKGLDADTYYLTEITAPAGYNKLSEAIEVVITGAESGENETLNYTTIVAKVENKAGTELPSTGGIGTTIFYIVGGVLVLGAVVLLVTKRRMSMNN